MGLMSNDLTRLSPAAQKQVMEKMRKPGKYKAQKTKRGKLTFDSKKEAERYDALMLLQKAGEIRGLKLQVRYCLQEAYTTFDGDKVKSIDYIADFVYERRTAPDSYGQRYWLPVVEDVKGMRTMTDAKRQIADTRPADVAPVVRCKDCRKFKTYSCRMVASGYDDFCSYGERKESADNG